MSSIGPQLPPHLQKRKRTPEDDAGPDSPSKVTRRANDEEIALDDESSDDEYGPSAGPAQSSIPKAPQQGPSLPPSSKNDNSTRPQQSIGPSMPPPPDRKQTHGPSPPGPSHIYGPTAPPAPLSTRPSTNPDSDSDDDYGPSLPSSTTPSTSLFDLPPSTTSASTAPKRDDWMLAPPTQSGYKAPDPTKLKSRKFASGPRANTSESTGISAIWTENPEEKAKRLRDAVLGRGDVTQGTGRGMEKKPERAIARTAADEEKIRLFTEQTRGKSLYEEHQARKKEEERKKGEEEDDDPSKRAFNWEKDMKSASVSNTQRKELLNKSADFGGRFQKGSYL